MKKYFNTPIGSIILGIGFAVLSLVTTADKVYTFPCVIGLILIIVGTMRGVSDKINPNSYIASRKEGLALLLLGVSLLFLNIYFWWRNYTYFPTLLLFGMIGLSVGIAMILYPSSINITVRRDKSDDTILDSSLDKAQRADIFQEQHWNSEEVLTHYWQNASKTAKAVWFLGLLVGGGSYLGLLYYLHNILPQAN